MIHDPYLMMTIMTWLSLMDYLRFQGNLNEFDPSLQGRLEGHPRGVPSVPLSSSATGTCRAGTSAHSVNLCGVPVELQVLYVKSCFLPSTHPTTWVGDTSAYLEFFRVEYWVQRLSEHIGESNVSGMAPGTFEGSVYTLRTFPHDGWGCVQIRS